MIRVAVCIGSNIGDREASIESMEQALGSIFCAPVEKSALMETEPVGVDAPQPWYLNRVIAGQYGGTALQLLDLCLALEVDLGRRRSKPRDVRTADVDILLFGDEVINSEVLTIPHPEISRRRFCLEGLRQIDSGWMVPGINKSIGELNAGMDPDVRDQKVFFPQLKTL